MSSGNGQLVRRAFAELWNQAKLEVADEIFAPDYVNHDPATPDLGKGPEAEKRMVTLYRTAFPDLQLTIDFIIEAGDLVSTRFSAGGTHKGEYRGIAPTNRSAKVAGSAVYLVSGGRITERWAVWDALGLMQQLGVVSAFEDGKASVEEVIPHRTPDRVRLWCGRCVY